MAKRKIHHIELRQNDHEDNPGNYRNDQVKRNKSTVSAHEIDGGDRRPKPASFLLNKRLQQQCQKHRHKDDKEIIHPPDPQWARQQPALRGS